ncbi:ribonuclease E/G [Pseudoruegeria sp. SK021]|uniref:ribonuclease E/G n=1 Tax=Pseudoruegeria sp. SK021 TaxID=1933035 RepID=UPI000A23C0B2|nr:ribonuclease E/G [Pseudoruegeria sp. SK021]OSP55559.1 ribonuclease E/G [Pseudoruegeria sp. SK021]
MAKKMLIDATHAEETRVVVVDGTKVEEFDFESENKRQLSGNIYLAKVTRVEPSLQAAFIDYGGNRHGFLAFSEIHPDYYQIPIADRQALMAEEKAYTDSLRAEDDADDTSDTSAQADPSEDKPATKPRRTRTRSRTRAAKSNSDDAVETRAVAATDLSGAETKTGIQGMDVVDLGSDQDGADHDSGIVATAEQPAAAPEGDADVKATADAPAAEDDEAPAADEARNDMVDDDSHTPADDIESVADDDTPEDINPPRRPRARRYKIQEVIKVRQILLVQVVKEERGNKGAALTTYLSLAGRYCVLMPNTARGGGISRKITNIADRKKLKQIATEIDVPEGAGLIVRTAGAKRTKAEIKRDYEYLQRLWEQVRELTLKSVAPAKIYEEGDLIKRSIRDLYNREIDEVFVEGEAGYRTAKDFMKMIMPSHARNVKHYIDPQPLFARFQVETYLTEMFNPTVRLKSGGYIVIGVTEALVAVDVNSGKSTKEGSIEDTALKTNLEAAEEVARQMRLRDLAGLIVIDFIDMDERKNNAAVEKRLKDKLKTDRARIQVGRISGFGLLEMSRQRLRPGMIEATTQPCHHCHGTGLIRSDDSLALSILRELEEEGVRDRSKEVLVRAPIGIVNYLINAKRDHIAQIEGRYGLSVRIEADPKMINPDFSVEKFKTATRKVELLAPVISSYSAMMEDEDDEALPEIEDEDDQDTADEAEAAAEAPAPAPAPSAEDEQPKPKKRRRRRRRRRGGADDENGSNGDGDDQAEGDASSDADRSTYPAVAGVVAAEGIAPVAVSEAEPAAADEAAKSDTVPVETAPVGGDSPATDTPAEPVTEVAIAPVEPAVETVPVANAEADATDVAPETVQQPAPVAEAAPAPAAPETVQADPTPEPVAAETVVAAPAPETVQTSVEAEPAAAPAAEVPAQAEVTPEPQLELAAVPEPAPAEKPKRRGWWSA